MLPDMYTWQAVMVVTWHVYMTSCYVTRHVYLTSCCYPTCIPDQLLCYPTCMTDQLLLPNIYTWPAVVTQHVYLTSCCYPTCIPDQLLCYIPDMYTWPAIMLPDMYTWTAVIKVMLLTPFLPTMCLSLRLQCGINWGFPTCFYYYSFLVLWKEKLISQKLCRYIIMIPMNKGTSLWSLIALSIFLGPISFFPLEVAR